MGTRRSEARSWRSPPPASAAGGDGAHGHHDTHQRAAWTEPGDTSVCAAETVTSPFIGDEACYNAIDPVDPEVSFQGATVSCSWPAHDVVRSGDISTLSRTGTYGPGSTRASGVG